MSKCVFLCVDILGEYDEGQCWEIKGNEARCINSGRPIGPQEHVVIPDGADLLDTLASLPEGAPWRLHDKSRFRLEETPMQRGGYYHRIYRDILGTSGGLSDQILSSVHDQEHSINAYTQSVILSNNLEKICRFVHPTKDNMSAYGHEIRNHLILVCTEVEAQFVGILQANAIAPQRGTYNTNDYVKLLPVMKLEQYAIKLWPYPWLDEIVPFASWSNARPTETLPWYAAYNAVKHDRENNFHLATLRHAMEATVAYNILIAAQYGQYRMGSPTYQLQSRPKWKRTEIYIPPATSTEASEWTPQKLVF